MLPEEKINDFFYPDITDDELFGYLTRYTMECFFDFDKVTGIRQQIEDLQSGIVIVYGVGAAYLCDLVIFSLICNMIAATISEVIWDFSI